MLFGIDIDIVDSARRRIPLEIQSARRCEGTRCHPVRMGLAFRLYVGGGGGTMLLERGVKAQTVLRRCSERLRQEVF